MTATSVTFSVKVASDWDPQKPLTTTKMNQLFDNTTNLNERLGGDYTQNTKNHIHDGIDSAAIQIGANYLRNGSFESGTSGWTLTPYTGGTLAIDTAHAMDGLNCLAITSTVLVNGGGYAQTSDYEVCSAGRMYGIRAQVMASVINISSKIEVVWFDSTKTQISLSTIYLSAATPITQTEIGTEVLAPPNAKFKQFRITGGVPGVGSATGTIYFDGSIACISDVRTGSVINFAGTTAPPGYLICPTAQTNISRTTYAGLFAAIGTQWGVGDGSTTFGMPWYAAGYTETQASANVGVATVGAVIAHSHVEQYMAAAGGSGNGMSNTAANGNSLTAALVSTASTGGAANYAAGTAMLKCVKY